VKFQIRGHGAMEESGDIFIYLMYKIDNNIIIRFIGTFIDFLIVWDCVIKVLNQTIDCFVINLYFIDETWNNVPVIIY